MSLADGHHAVPPGHLATIVTCLEMTAPAGIPVPALPPGIALQRIAAPATDWYREIFARIGANWLWTSRLVVEETALAVILQSPDIEIWTLHSAGRDEALLELDFRRQGRCELSFLGLSGPLCGRGFGRLLLAHAAARAWSRPITAFRVQTCTHDHPAALDLYRRFGFAARRREVDVMADPRLTGLLPIDAAPHVPLIGPGP